MTIWYLFWGNTIFLTYHLFPNTEDPKTHREDTIITLPTSLFVV